jgi:hypothetical protein
VRPVMSGRQEAPPFVVRKIPALEYVSKPVPRPDAR